MYSIVQENNLFKIKEIASENYIASYKDKNEARKEIKRLKKGFGFRGFTPGFFTIDR